MTADLVRRFYTDLWERADRSAADEILSSDLRFRGSLGVSADGVDGFWAYLESVRAALDDYRCDIVELVADGDKASARMRFHGVHRGRFLDVEMTGRRIEWSGAAFFERRDGRLSEIWVLGDVDGLRAALQAAKRARTEPRRRVAFFVSLQSPYCYFALDRALALDALDGVDVEVRPVLPAVLRAPELHAHRSPLEQDYFLRDVARTAAFLDLPYAEADPYPVAFEPGSLWRAPTDQPLIDRLYGPLVIAARQGRGLAFLDKALRLLWSGRFVGWDQGDHLAKAIAAAGLDVHALSAEAATHSDDVAATLAENDAAMRAAGHWGVPLFVLDGEPFYGQDRFDQLLWRLGLTPEDL